MDFPASLVEVLFYITAALIILSGLGVVLFRHPIYSAVSLLVVFFGVFAIFLLLRAEFLAVIQLLIYTGAILVLYLFALMLLDLGSYTGGKTWITWTARSAALGVGFIFLFLELSYILSKTQFPVFPQSSQGAALRFSPETVESLGGNAVVLGKVLFTKYVIPFEITGVLFFVALIGGIVIARRESDES